MEEEVIADKRYHCNFGSQKADSWVVMDLYCKKQSVIHTCIHLYCKNPHKLEGLCQKEARQFTLQEAGAPSTTEGGSEGGVENWKTGLKSR